MSPVMVSQFDASCRVNWTTSWLDRVLGKGGGGDDNDTGKKHGIEALNYQEGKYMGNIADHR